MTLIWYRADFSGSSRYLHHSPYSVRGPRWMSVTAEILKVAHWVTSFSLDCSTTRIQSRMSLTAFSAAVTQATQGVV